MTLSGRSKAIALAIALLATVWTAGCGSSVDGSNGGDHPNYERALAGSPPPLAALYRQANRILPGGVEAFERRIASLRGYPVVVNLWASWCGPCRFEFPDLQKASARHGKRVAFLGINSEDSDDYAESFLAEAPVPYPSYSDPDKALFHSLGARGFPDTAFFDRRGKLVFLKQGAYADGADLEADIRRYALESG